MKTNPGKFRFMTILLVVIFASMSNIVMAQTDSTNVAKSDSTKEGKKKKKRDEIIVYAGANVSTLSSSTEYETNSDLGYQLGISYKRGRYFYWQVGAKYAYTQYKLTPQSGTPGMEDNLALSSFDVPVTAGVNFLAFVNRLVALRLFVSAVPSFTLSVKDNDLGVTKDDLNTFMFYGQGGLGINIAFFVIETGYNYGFQDSFKGSIDSKPGQFFVNLGFRF